MIRNYNIIRSILSEPWLLSKEKAGGLGYLLSGVFSPMQDFEPVEREDQARVAYIRPYRAEGSGAVHNVGVVNITGVLTKYDPVCAYGMETYGQMIRQLDADPEVSAIVLCIDSPGGEVQGTEELGEIIGGVRKPVVAFVSDCACSGAYWLASRCREIIANNTTAEVGSIGVLCTYWDFSDYYERQGIKVHEILAPQSIHKREEPQQIKEGKYDLTRERLQVIASKFQDVVRASRPRVEDVHLTGKVYFAKDVQGTLVDRIGTFEEAAARAVELASTNTHENMAKEHLPKLAAAAGVTALETVDGTITLSADMAEKVEAALPDKTAVLKESLEEATAAFTRWAEVEKGLSAALERIQKLEKSPGDQGAAVTPETDALGEDHAPATSFAEALTSARAFVKQHKN